MLPEGASCGPPQNTPARDPRMSAKRPVIGLPADRRMVGHHAYHLAGEKYLTAILDAAGGIPLIIPAIGRELALDELLGAIDGLLFTGSPSNVEPQHYRGDPSEPGTLHDPQRDATTLPLVPKAVAAGIPLLGICRGLQEINVALGGTLWQKLHMKFLGTWTIASPSSGRSRSSTGRRTKSGSSRAVYCGGSRAAMSCA